MVAIFSISWVDSDSDSYKPNEEQPYFQLHKVFFIL